jgi:signal peptidase II
VTRRGELARAGVVALLALALDQITKAIVRMEIARGDEIDLILGVDLVRVKNDGIAFGLLGGAGPAVIVLAGAAFVLLLAFFLQKGELETLWLPIGLIAGGALGNLTDRVLDGAVTDFIDPPNWPAFNAADIEITVGVLILVGLYIRDAVREERSAERPESNHGGEKAPDR